MAILAAALAALVCLLVWWPTSPGLLNKQINATYAAVVAQNARELTHLVPELPLSWERTALGFSGSPNL